MIYYILFSLDSEGKKEITVCLIKPDAVAAGKVPEIIADVRFDTLFLLHNMMIDILHVLRNLKVVLDDEDNKTLFCKLRQT